jgi:hypothetical protein
VKFTDVDVKRVDYTDPAHVYAVVDFSAKDAANREIDRIRGFQLLKGNDGVWRLHGDRQVIEMSADVMMIRSTSDFGTCTSTGIEFFMEDFDPSNNGSLPIESVVVYGPGLPQSGVRYVRPDLGGWWPIQGQSSNFYVMNNSCVDVQPVSESAIRSIPDDAVYLAVGFDGAGNRVDLPGGLNRPGTFAHGAYALSIDRRPLTAAEAQASTSFPTITSPASRTAFASYTGGDLKIVATGMNPKVYADAVVTLASSGGEEEEADTWASVSEQGVLDLTLSLDDFGSTPIAWRSLRVMTYDDYRRTFMTVYN